MTIHEAKDELHKAETAVPINLGPDGKLYPFCVSLAFLLDFLKAHPEAEQMTTAEVVQRIIVPETKESRLTYVEAKLVGKHPNYFRVMSRKSFSIDEQISFLSHAWLMPFRVVIGAAVSSMRPLFCEMFSPPPPPEKYVHKSFFWVDVFCKNQHIPAPAMDEFETAMRLSNQVVLALYPGVRVKIDMLRVTIDERHEQHRQAFEDAANGKFQSAQPIVLSRIWCLFEIMTCLNMKKSLVPAVADDQLEDIRTDFFVVDVCKAQATVPADIELILGLVKESVGIDEMNRSVKRAVEDSIQLQITSLDPPACFDGDGWVYTPGDCDASNNNDDISVAIAKKYVKELRRGDKVLTCLAPAAAYTALRSHVKANDNSSAAAPMSSLFAQSPSLFAWSTVALVTKDDVSSLTVAQADEEGPMSLWDVQGLAITAEHPVWDGERSAWVKAKECTGSRKTEKTLNFVYNVELDGESNGGVPHGNVLVNDVMVITLGHGYDFDEYTDRLYGFGWKENPKRAQRIKLQTIREGNDNAPTFL